MWVFVVGSDAVSAGICQLTQHFDAEPPRGGLDVGAGSVDKARGSILPARQHVVADRRVVSASLADQLQSQYRAP
jgi:small ligand-binding sensory domain FIST